MKKNFWDVRAIDYDSTINKVYAEANTKIIDKASKYCDKNTKLLDIGCGTGLLTIKLAKLVKSVDAIDLSIGMLNVAKKNAKDNHVNNIIWKQGDLEVVSGRYNIITAFNILLYIDKPDEFILECSKHLTEDGYLIIVTDCLAQVNTIRRLIYKLGMAIGTLGVFPKYKMFKMKDIDYMITQQELKMVENENVYTVPPNYMIIAQR